LLQEQQAAQEARAEQVASDRRCVVLTGELQEVRAQLETAEKDYKTIQVDLNDAVERNGDLTNANAALQTAKRKLDADFQAIHV